MSLAPGTRLGVYEITEPIGACGMGDTAANLQVKALAGEAQPRVIAPRGGFSQTDVSPDGRS